MTTHTITNAQRDISFFRQKNLYTLAHFLLTSPRVKDHFNMQYYSSKTEENGLYSNEYYGPYFERHAGPDQYHKCGTSHCAAGWGPFCGIEPEQGEDWVTYMDRVFIPGKHKAWRWCFSGIWARRDNDPTSAGKRILWFLSGRKAFLCSTCHEEEFAKVIREYKEWVPTERDNLIFKIISELDIDQDDPSGCLMPLNYATF